MKKFLKRITTLALCGAVSVGPVLTFTACQKETTVVDGKTVNIRVCERGNGVEWLYTLKEKFEAVYADKGYKLNILEPSYDMAGTVALTDMALGTEETGVDLYFTGDFPIEQVGVNGDYGLLAEDIEDIVFNQPAIGYDGKEEDVLISSKIDPERVQYSIDSTGVMYGFQSSGSVAGLAVNTTKLKKYGLELPRTTNEMLECIDKIYLGTNGMQHSESSGIFPITYVSGSNGYVVCALDTWLAQYDREMYDKFWSMQEVGADGVKTDMKTNGYEVFNMKNVEEMLTLGYAVMDQRISTRGSTTQNLDQAQAKIMQNNTGAVFMFNGSWLLNEVRLNYKNYLNDITFINFPVVSSLGTKLMGAGTSYNFSDAKCEEILSYVIGLVDENKEISEIVASVNTEFGVALSDAVAQEIASARGIIYDRGTSSYGIINKGAKAKEPAALLLRMMASDDFSQTYLETTRSTSPYNRNVDLSGVQYEFVKEAAKISTNRYQNIITGVSGSSGLRKALGLSSTFTHTSHIPSKIYEKIVSIYDGKGGKLAGATGQVYRDAAKALQKKEYDNAKSKWTEWLTNAGIS